jgi:hypothetical protein
VETSTGLAVGSTKAISTLTKGEQIISPLKYNKLNLKDGMDMIDELSQDDDTATLDNNIFKDKKLSTNTKRQSKSANRYSNCKSANRYSNYDDQNKSDIPVSTFTSAGDKINRQSFTESQNNNDQLNAKLNVHNNDLNNNSKNIDN